ncbi:hypothetical protein [Alkalinema sp. FACHB-956]|uniref:hypothetical protein n=1 Tax=Alkalinema sp. FACHB-956 TaxID=2692768 RepID=UPI001685A88D|nr:hypothetical protein [Alkalinema sp. FACHB-956]MBD2328842.1 hypothetical protein [Alkalinema sp. FACHB-956]
MQKIAQVISDIFNPLVIASMTFFLLVTASSELNWLLKILAYVITLLFSSLIVFGYVFYLKYLGVVKSTELVQREERIIPLTVALLSYALGYVLLTMLKMPLMLRGLMLCYAANTLMILIITRRWKISLHTTGIAGPIVALTYQFGLVMIPFYSLIPLVGLSRIVSQRQQVPQVVAGGLLGLVMTALQLHFFLGR